MQENKRKCLVVGDVMIDRHVRGEVRRISPEAPVPVIDVIGEPEVSIGAAGYVAAQIAKAGIEVALCYKGHRDNCDIEMMLGDSTVMCCPLYGAHSRHINTVKTRVWTDDQQICRIDEEDKTKPSAEIEAKWIKQISCEIAADEYDCVVFSDYDKGTLTDHIIQSVADCCKRFGVLTILDPKRYSYFGLQNLFLIKPNKHEINITNMTPLKISEELGRTYLLNTLSDEGMAIYRNGNEIDRIKTAGNNVVDVCGAGDITTAMLAISLVAGNNAELAMKHAAIAASMVILHKGCYIINSDVIDMILEDDGK